MANFISEKFLSAYGIFGTGESCEPNLESVVVVNLRMHHATEMEEQRGSVEVVLLRQVSGRGMGVKRLKGPGADVADGITWAGRMVDTQGNLGGNEVVEEMVGDIPVLSLGRELLRGVWSLTPWFTGSTRGICPDNW